MDLFDQINDLRSQGQPFATATVVRVEKPTSAKPGAKAVITQDGRLHGWVGGSCAEPHVKQVAKEALRDGLPRLLRLCPPEKMGTEPQEGVTELKITCTSGGTLEIYIEPFLAQPRLVVVGHQAAAQALVSLGKALEYHVTALGEDASEERFPGADRIIDGLDFSQVAVTPNTYIVVASHGNYDELALEALLPKPAAYIALVASKKRSEEILNFLRASGMSEDALAKLKYPAGLDFGAQTPAEIALSILAEIIQVRRRGMQAGHGVPGMQGMLNAHPLAGEKEGEGIKSAAYKMESVPGAGPEIQTYAELELDSLPETVSQADAEPETAIDPVCGMSVEIATAKHRTTYAGKTYYFCAAQCQHRFEKNPEEYLEEVRSEK